MSQSLIIIVKGFPEVRVTRFPHSLIVSIKTTYVGKLYILELKLTFELMFAVCRRWLVINSGACTCTFYVWGCAEIFPRGEC